MNEKEIVEQIKKCYRDRFTNPIPLGYARSLLLALGFTRNTPYAKIEWTTNTPPHMDFICAILENEIPPPDNSWNYWDLLVRKIWKEPTAEMISLVENWLKTPPSESLIQYHRELERKQCNKPTKNPDTNDKAIHKRALRFLKKQSELKEKTTNFQAQIDAKGISLVKIKQAYPDLYAGYEKVFAAAGIKLP
jgi:hypothetical protein